jgi:hypothetical protein
MAGQAYDEVLQLKALWKLQKEKESVAAFASAGDMNGGEDVDENGGAVACVNVVSNGGEIAQQGPFVASGNGEGFSGLSDLSPSAETLNYLLSFIASPVSESDGLLGFHSFGGVESDILWQHIHQCSSLPLQIFAANTLPVSMAYRATVSSSSPSFDLTKEPLSYSEAIARPNAIVWRVL